MSDVRPVAPDAVRWIARTLEEAGYETWAVGGAVRDALLGRPSGDWDLATRATPKQVRRAFRRTVPIGVDHGTVGVLARDGVMYEVTTFRRDIETDGRHAVVAFADTIEEDLGRRDFTINAIAWHPLDDRVIDPFDGAADLKAKCLRTVGDPAERFREDYLRILRAVRFAGRFGLKIHDDTWSALRSLTGHLPSLSPERIRDELLKLLSADPTPSVALSLYRSSGITAVLYPELDALDESTWARALEVVEWLPCGRPHLRLAALVRPLSRVDAAALLVRLRLSNADTDTVATRAGADSLPGASEPAAARRRWLSRYGAETMRGVARLDLADARSGPEGTRSDAARRVVDAWCALRAELRAGPPLTIGMLAIDGRDLMKLGLRPGPLFGEVLDALLEQVLDDPALNDADALRGRALDEAERLQADPDGARSAGTPGGRDDV